MMLTGLQCNDVTKGVSRVFLGCFKDALRMFQGIFNGVSKMFHGCLKDI